MFLEKSDWLGLLGFILIQFAGSYVKVDRNEYRRGSSKFSGAPPGWLFGPAWILLRFLRGIGGFLYWKEGPTDLGTLYSWTLALYAINIILDFQWMPLFFGEKNAGSSLVVVTLMLLTALAVTIFVAVGAALTGTLWVAFAFFLVYLAWIGLATYLNAQWFSKGIWNRLEREDRDTLPTHQDPSTSKKKKQRKHRNTDDPTNTTVTPLSSSLPPTQQPIQMGVFGHRAIKMPGKNQ